MKKALSFLYFFLCASMLFSVTALAYIDPSAMTYMIQLIAGIAIAAGAGLGFYFRKIRRSLSRFTKKDRAAASLSYDEEDDDLTGFGDYEVEETGEAESAASAAGVTANAATQIIPPGASPLSETDISRLTDVLRAEARQTARRPEAFAEDRAADPYDETGGEGGLAAENRELRRLLAEERQKVELLKQALHICTAPGK